MNGRPITPARPPAPREVDPDHPLPVSGGGSLAASIAELRRQAAAYRQASIDWITRDHQRGRQLLHEAEVLETRVVLLKAAGLSGTYQPFRRHFL